MAMEHISIDEEAEGEQGITEFLLRFSQGDRQAINQVVPLMYDQLRQLARVRLRRSNGSQTLQTAALINEAYLRIATDGVGPLADRRHFLAIAAQAMRWILVDHERSRLAAKRGGGATCVSLQHDLQAPQADVSEVDVLALDQALERLAELDAQQCRIVELRYFGGLSIDETADCLGTSPAMVKRAWASARAWLLHELSDGVADR